MSAYLEFINNMSLQWISWSVNQLMALCGHLGVFFVLAGILFILQKWVLILANNMLSGRLIYISAWIGTPVHELSHALCCVLFGHKIQQIVLFNPDRRGTLGYVTHSYDNRRLWKVLGNFLIGIAPLFGGLGCIYLLTLLLLEDSGSLLLIIKSAFMDDLYSIHLDSLLTLSSDLVFFFKNAYLASPYHVVTWAYLCAAISLHLSPSKEDLKGAWSGLLLFLVFYLIGQGAYQYLGGEWDSGLIGGLNLLSTLSVIGIILASLLLLFLLVYRMTWYLFKRLSPFKH